ncbi:DNA-3-methyladenine glycosylase I [Ameyamaea chiangmaiensis NBRC 103196]
MPLPFLGDASPHRCAWACQDPLLKAYHDAEWGVPVHDGRALWEKLMLDGFQAGLSWRIILQRRDALRAAFAGFDPDRVASFTSADVTRLLQDAAIIRSRAKIEATIGNARAYVAMRARGEPFGPFVWAMVGERSTGSGLTRTPLSEALARALRQRGFRFVGPVIVHAWMQAVGMIDDHEPGCFRAGACATAASGRDAS